MAHAFYCEFPIILTDANHYPTQCLTVVWLIVGSSLTPILSLAADPVVPYDLFYAWASRKYQGLSISPGSRLRRLSKIGMRLAFLHGNY